MIRRALVLAVAMVSVVYVLTSVLLGGIEGER